MNQTAKGKKGIRKSQKTVSVRAVWILASKLYRADRRRNITAVAAISLSSMMVILVLSTVMSIITLMSRQKQMMLGTQAEGIYMNTSYHWFEELRDSGYFDATGMVVYMGHYETMSNGVNDTVQDHNLLLYAEEETAGWNFNELLEGRWAQSNGEVVVDEHFVDRQGGNVRTGDRIQLRFKTAVNEEIQEVTITGICAANDALDEARIYVSREFFLTDRSGFMLRTYCRFEGGRYSEEDLMAILRKINPEAVANVIINPVAAGSAGNSEILLMGGLIFLTVICAGLMIYTVYYISSVKNVIQYGQLKLIGVAEAHIRQIVRIHAIRQYLTGFPIGCLTGLIFGHVILPGLASFAGIKGTPTLVVRPVYFLCAAVLSFVVLCIGVARPMTILAKLPPVRTVGFTDGGSRRTGRIHHARFSAGVFALKNLGKRSKKTMLVVVSMSVVMLLFVGTMNVVHSLNMESFLEEINLFADIEIATEHTLRGMEVGYTGNAEAIPIGLRNELEKISEGMETVYHYNLDVPSFLYGEDAERFCKLVLDSGNYEKVAGADESNFLIQRARNYRETGTPIVVQQTYRFYDYEQIKEFEIFEGNIDKEQFESGRYVVAVALDGEGDSYYHVGDKVNLYEEFPEDSVSNYRRDENGRYVFFDNLPTREYEVLAVVSDEYRNQMSCGSQHIQDFEFILPTQSMNQMSRMPELFMVTMDARDAAVLEKAEPLIKACLDKMGGVDVVSYRSRGVYKRMMEEFSLVIFMIGNGLAVMVGMMALANFLNSCVSGLAERKEEFSTLLAIGMTKGQLLKVLKLENLYIVLLAVVPGYLLGQLISAVVVSMAAEKIPYLAWDMSLMPGIFLAVIMAALSMVYPNRRTALGSFFYSN